MPSLGPLWPFIAVALAMCLRDVFGTLVTASVAHGRSTWAANFDVLCDLGSYLVPALGITAAGALSWQTIGSVMAGGWVGTKCGTSLSIILERKLNKPVPHRLRTDELH